MKQVDSEERMEGLQNINIEGLRYKRKGAVHSIFPGFSKTDQFYQLMLQLQMEKILWPNDGTNTAFKHFPTSKMTYANSKWFPHHFG